MDISDFIKLLIQHQIQLKIMHWMTESFSQHMALQEIYEAVEDFLDKFAETWIGFENELSIEKIEIEPKNATESIACVEDLADVLQTAKEALDPKDSTVSFLINDIDGLLSECYHTIYKLRRLR